MKFEEATLGVSFELPNPPTVRDVLTYDSRRIELAGEAPAIIILWECVKLVIRDWKCETIPDIWQPIDEMTGRDAAAIIRWAAFRGSDWRQMRDEVPKN